MGRGGGGAGQGGTARVSEFFFSKISNVKTNFFFISCFLFEEGVGARGSVFFYKESKSKIFFF